MGKIVRLSVGYFQSFPQNQYINTRITNPAMEIKKNGIYPPFLKVRIAASSIKAIPIRIIMVMSSLFLGSPLNQPYTGISHLFNMHELF